MDDGGSPVVGLTVFIILLFLNAVFCSFITALEHVNESLIEKLAKEGNKRAVWLENVMEYPQKISFPLQILMAAVSIIIGMHGVRVFGGYITTHFLVAKAPDVLRFLCYIATAVVLLFLLASVGIIAPQKIAMRRADRFALNLAGIMKIVVAVIFPFSYLCDKLSNLIVRIFRIDPNENPVDVTEEEIKSVVNEGHEQGVLLDSEAKMIHNIIEFADKGAKEIMTHRKNITAVDGKMHLKAALEFMLEKNNTRFPVFDGDMDNIIGVVHIKDTMIQSGNEDMLSLPLDEIPGLIRDVSFIPETRNINTLFKTMQTEKSQIVIVVDEYGQTAGLVAMEDILEEIVGNILDEYDEDETMIIEEVDGSYLMSGMAALDEVFELLKITEEAENYETLNGYLIGLIDKIPTDHEMFEITAQGYLFQVLEVENKFIQTVKVRKIEEPSSIVEENTCEDKKYVVE